MDINMIVAFGGILLFGIVGSIVSWRAGRGEHHKHQGAER